MANRISHIDGLRAVSIVAVVLFHAFPLLFPSGYLGVDYFLVISGYVISRKYFFDSASEFNILDFWRRRISRLYPQLLTCILISTPFAFLLMQPDYFENFSQSVIATIFGANNILLYLTGGYWTIANEMKPLFTTWSLGLEEQFYLFSIVLIAFFGLKSRRILICFSIIAIISFLICQYASVFYPRANFLLLPFRLWEFAIGIYAAYLASKSYRVAPVIVNLSLFVILLFLVLPLRRLWKSQAV
jgi:peptidoglycan/LPS O-acetylase OafA/YrhL